MMISSFALNVPEVVAQSIARSYNGFLGDLAFFLKGQVLDPI